MIEVNYQQPYLPNGPYLEWGEEDQSARPAFSNPQLDWYQSPFTGGWRFRMSYFNVCIAGPFCLLGSKPLGSYSTTDHYLVKFVELNSDAIENFYRDGGPHGF